MFLVAGESLVDLIGQAGSWRFTAAPGGSPLNVAVALAAAGQPVRLASQVGDDLFGQLLRRHLADQGVDTADLLTGESTSLAFALVDYSGAASYDFRFSWRWSAAPSLDGVAAVHVGSLAAVTDPGADAVRALAEAAHRRHVPVCYDPNVRPALMGDPDRAAARVRALVAHAAVVRVSREDLAWLHPDEPDLAVARRWLTRGPALVVVTRGRQGAVALGRDGYAATCTPPEVTVVDTIGAGDAFTAGLLASFAEDRVLAGLAGDGAGRAPLAPAAVDGALRQATATATAVCARRGATPPEPGQVGALARDVVVTRGL